MTVLQDRRAGVCLHLTSLPGPRGVGEIGRAAYRFIDAMDAMELGVWQFLPLAPTGYGDSPYQPLSVYAGNPLLIDLELLEQDGFVTADEISDLEDLPVGTVDFDRLIPLKSQILARAGERFTQVASSAMRAARDEFVAEHDSAWLHDFALFEVLRVMHQQRAWHEWDPAFARRDPAAMKALEKTARTQIEAIKSIQYLFFEQWSRLKAYAVEKRVRLMGDIPIFVAMDSADAWARPELLNLDEDANRVRRCPARLLQRGRAALGEPTLPLGAARGGRLRMVGRTRSPPDEARRSRSDRPLPGFRSVLVRASGRNDGSGR